MTAREREEVQRALEAAVAHGALVEPAWLLERWAALCERVSAVEALLPQWREVTTRLPIQEATVLLEARGQLRQALSGEASESAWQTEKTLRQVIGRAYALLSRWEAEADNAKGPGRDPEVLGQCIEELRQALSGEAGEGTP